MPADQSNSGAPDHAAPDDVRAKMKAALERKQHKQHASAESAKHDGSEKSHGATEPTKEPNYRRKAI